MKLHFNRAGIAIAMMALFVLAIAATSCSSSSNPVAVADPVASVTASDAWVRADLDPTAVYLTLTNSGSEPVMLSHVEADWAGEVGMHQTVDRDGLLSMEHVMSMSVPAGGTLALAPGGFHLMAQGLNTPIAEGDSLKLALVTDSGERIQFTAIARGIGSTGSTVDDSMMDHDHDMAMDDDDSAMDHDDDKMMDDNAAMDHDHDMTMSDGSMDVEAHGAVFSSGTIPPGKSFEFTFDHSFEDLMVPYHNHLSGDAGSIMVMEGAEISGAVTVKIDEQGFHPSELHVSPGTAVTWVNETEIAWTVLNGYHPDSHR